MDNISTCNNQYSLFTKYCEHLSKVEQFFWSSSIIETHTDHWNICYRKKMYQSGPDSMIKSTIRIFSDPKITSTFNSILDLSCYLEGTRCIIFHSVKFRGKSSHIIDHSRLRIHCDTSLSWSNPMC